MSHPMHLCLLILFTVKANSVPTNNTESWGGKWFPRIPLKEHTAQNDLNELFNTKEIEAKSNSTESWNGKWFPSTPSEGTIPSRSRQVVDDSKEPWRGKWFPSNTSEGTKSSSVEQVINDNKESWNGKWFPNAPGKDAFISGGRSNNLDSECDDGKNNIDIDFDPEDKRHSYNYLCLDHKIKYEPSFATSPIQKNYIIPPAYKAPSYCLNETIEYEDRIPTYGAHRHLYPKYGEYKYLPVQRWMHSLEYGAIVMLYHPCAYQMQVEKLRNTLNACLYRHIITPSTLLLPERPLSLVAWSKSLEMSVVDVSTVVDFIKENAKKGAQTMEHDIQKYDAGLLNEAKLVTDESDSEICANINL